MQKEMAILLLCFFATLRLCATSLAAEPIRVLIKTDKGAIEAELAADKAPGTVANFLRYVDGHLYDGGRFHRTVTMANQPDDKIKIEVIQAAPDPSKKEFP